MKLVPILISLLAVIICSGGSQKSPPNPRSAKMERISSGCGSAGRDDTVHSNGFNSPSMVGINSETVG
jgi:hypothetical protein